MELVSPPHYAWQQSNQPLCGLTPPSQAVLAHALQPGPRALSRAPAGVQLESAVSLRTTHEVLILITAPRCRRTGMSWFSHFLRDRAILICSEYSLGGWLCACTHELNTGQEGSIPCCSWTKHDMSQFERSRDDPDIRHATFVVSYFFQFNRNKYIYEERWFIICILFPLVMGICLQNVLSSRQFWWKRQLMLGSNHGTYIWIIYMHEGIVSMCIIEQTYVKYWYLVV